MNHGLISVPSLKQNRGAYWNETAYLTGALTRIRVLNKKKTNSRKGAY